MMQEYSSEQEQIEAIKKWFRENGLAIFIGIAVGFGGLYGWQSWQSYVNKRAEEASSLYSQILVNLDNAQTASVPKATDELIENYSATPYASLAALAAAKVAAVDGNYEQAKERLQWVIDNAQQVQLVPLAKVRLARLFILEKNIDAAAALIEGVPYPASYSARVAELQGDLYSLRGETSLARSSYSTALSAALPAQNREMIQVKLDSLQPDNAEAAPAEETAESTGVTE
ncbi:MAG: tetratricopeptide repeat protein [Gammaproteobacteria bacterium]|nr:tetratricopeptide repeat protein [Gammaproteobacteria bacterium]